MITGLRLRITSDELREHLAKRSAYHHDRAESKRKELPALKEALEKITKVSPAANVTQMHGKSNYAMDSNNPVEDLETDINTHTNKALAFAFMASHLFSEDYDLREEDLVRIEILRRF